MNSPKDYLTDRVKEYKRKFNHTCFTFNADTSMGLKAAKYMYREILSFLTETIQQSMEVGRKIERKSIHKKYAVVDREDFINLMKNKNK